MDPSLAFQFSAVKLGSTTAFLVHGICLISSLKILIVRRKKKEWVVYQRGRKSGISYNKRKAAHKKKGGGA